MRLKHIKLAGFKSFVDPTKVPFEQQMTAIVGPNGCGKSNIIDAVRWVLGESSAKNLRGDAMTDVIFNGASTRKAVGQASVELLFDNMEERIQGSMADRNQVSIRRVVNRDSQNIYYLNGTKCRRKDIIDIFLGTGLGPRSYAIIEQGTISRLIESKPQELRVFIEEAAGISKYKERRRDTEIRIRHTRENLERLFDIRTELNTQIEKLHQQAEAAKRFKTLKGQERKIKAELAVLRWQKFNHQFKSNQSRCNELQEQIKINESHQVTDGIALFTAKQNFQTANQTIQLLQQKKIGLTNDIARLEQQIKHLNAQQKKMADDKLINQQQMSKAQKSLLVEQEQLKILNDKLDVLQPQYQQLVQELAEHEQNYKISNEQLQIEQQTLQRFHQEKEKQSQQKLEETKKKAQYHEIIEQKNSRLNIVIQQMQLLESVKNLDNEFEFNKLGILKEQVEQLLIQKENNDINKQEHQSANLGLAQQQSKNIGTSLALEKQIEQLTLKLTYQADWQKTQDDWLIEQSVNALGVLQQQLTIEDGWELAVEMVLSHLLQARFIDDFPIKNFSEQSTPQSLLLLNYAFESTPKVKTLSEKISGGASIYGMLNRIKIADSYQTASEMLMFLNEGESVICPQGFWLSNNFIRKGLFNEKNDHFSDVNTLNEQKQQLEALKQESDELNNQISKSESLQYQLSVKREEIVNQLTKKQTKLTQVEKSEALHKQKIDSEMQQRKDLYNEQQTLEKEISVTTELLNELAKVTLKAEQENLTAGEYESIDSLTERVQLLQDQTHSLQAKQKVLIDNKHQFELTIEKTNNSASHCLQTVTRFQENIIQLTEQQTSNNNILDEGIAPLIKDENQLQAWLIEMSTLDQELLKAQKTLNTTQETIQSIEQKQSYSVEEINKLKESLNQLQIDGESYRLKAQAAIEQLDELRENVKSVQQLMPQNARESQWQAQLIKLAKDIQLLGAINLAAIEEFETQLTRKNYLDQQDQDLNLAISTLESAIEKIDKESRHKFKTTFDKVNQDLQSLFPKVFGGGQAYLTLTGEDLLDTGVTIMARPPGKKNSTIHLLSGGEKALTALSLVFAIFRLNPAPFCMLDEVDAPLDDANVSRFCNLVKEMSQTVQFIYISHNKIAMEMASHLTGVTMFEAGVSRMVAVDLDEAVAMAEVS
jgi:chromosome segregation protein